MSNKYYIVRTVTPSKHISYMEIRTDLRGLDAKELNTLTASSQTYLLAKFDTLEEAQYCISSEYPYYKLDDDTYDPNPDNPNDRANGLIEFYYIQTSIHVASYDKKNLIIGLVESLSEGNS